MACEVTILLEAASAVGLSNKTLQRPNELNTWEKKSGNSVKERTLRASFNLVYLLEIPVDDDHLF